MNAVRFTRRLTTALALMVAVSIALLMAGAQPALADTYDVQAHVPGSNATQPATIDPALDGSSTDQALLVISGNCQTLNPSSVVVIMRNGSVAGSAPCGSSGTYSLTIMLQTGPNTLVARTANASNIYGPDSQPTLVTLTIKPAPPGPVIPSTPAAPSAAGGSKAGQPEAGQDVTITNDDANDAAASGLKVSVQPVFSTLGKDRQVKLRLTIGGGRAPYDVQLLWDDGEDSSDTQSGPGTVEYSHQYQLLRLYTIRGTVRDAAGAAASFEHAVVYSQLPPAGAANQSTETGQGEGKLLGLPVPLVFTAGGALAVTALAVAVLYIPFVAQLAAPVTQAMGGLAADLPGKQYATKAARQAGRFMKRHSIRLWDNHDKIPALIAVLALLGGGYAGFAWWYRPAEGTVTRNGIEPPAAVASPQTVDWQTAYFSTKRPAAWRIQLSKEQSGSANPIAGSYLLTHSTGRQSSQIAVTIGKLQGRLDEIPAVKLRISDPATYRPSQPDFLPEGGLAFEKQGDYETSLFWSRGDQYVSIVASGAGAPRAEIDELLSTMVGQWRWL